MQKTILSIYFFLLCIAQTFGQALLNTQDKYWEVGLQLNAMNYFGDLAPKNEYLS